MIIMIYDNLINNLIINLINLSPRNEFRLITPELLRISLSIYDPSFSVARQKDIKNRSEKRPYFCVFASTQRSDRKNFATR